MRREETRDRIGLCRAGRRASLSSLALVGALAVVLLGACGSECDDFVSPCPKPFDVGAWCEQNAGCTVDGMPAECRGFGGCNLKPGEVLSVPIGQFVSSLQANELKVAGSNGGCGDAMGFGPEDYVVSLDGQAGSYHPFNGDALFKWAPFPTSAQALEVRFGEPGGDGCLDVGLFFLDGTCELENPEPECPQ